LAQAIDIARLGTFEWNLASDEVTLDARSRAIFAFDEGEGACAQDVFDRIHPTDFPHVHAAAMRSLAEGTRLEISYRLLLPGGHVRTIESLSDVVAGGDGQAERVVGVFVDVTERTAAEMALRASEARQRFRVELGDALRPLSSPSAIQAQACRLLCMHLHAARVHYAEVEPHGDYVFVPKDHVRDVPDLAGRHCIAEFSTLVAECQSGRTFIATNIPGDTRLNAAEKAAFAALPVAAIVVVPLVKEGRWVAHLSLQHSIPHEWESAEVQLIEEAAERTWAAIERARAETSLLELNATLAQRVQAATAQRDRTWNNSRELLLVVDLDGIFRAVNPAWTSVLGYQADELIGRSYLEFIHPEDQFSAHLALQREREQAVPGYENRYRHKDGSYRWISWISSIENELIYASGRDVSAENARQEELRAIEAAHRAADALYRAYFENTAELLFVVGVLPDGGYVVEDLNPAHQATMGLPLTEVRGKRIDEILPAHTAEVVMSHYRRVLESGQVYQYRETFELNGESTYWDTVLVPVRDQSGQVARIIGSSRDLTRQVAAEEQLRQAQKMEAMGQLTGGVAHDFNNLLTPIVSVLDMLQRRGLGGEREQRLISGAAQSAERAKTLVQRLLAFARRQPLQPIAVDVSKLVRGMADLVSSTTGPQIRVVVEAADELPYAKADPNQLEMALLNLAVNARDAMPDGGTLRISVCADAVTLGSSDGLRPGRYLRLSIADTGTGMSEATLARAVEPFFSTKGVGKGTGLGLSMVHGLASQLGGALKISSKLGLGTNVELWLPETEEMPSETHAAREVTSTQARGLVLLVEDEEIVRLSTADTLEELGFDVTAAANAEEALEFIHKDHRFDLVVTDHLMPGMTGTALARLLRERRPELPVLLVSGYAGVEGVAPDLPRLTKPFRKDQLATSIAALWSRA
jgi:PAS domain S-box-containing protein